MDRSGLATGTRAVATKLWHGQLPNRPPAEMTRELYEAENQGKADPSGSQDMVGLVYPGINRLDYDFAANGGVFPAHIESLNDERSVRWLEQVIHVLPVAPRPEGYNPLGQKNLEPRWVARLGQTGKDCFEAIRRRDLPALGASLNECMVCWENCCRIRSGIQRCKCGPDRPAAGLSVALCRGDVFGLRRGLPVGGVQGTGAGGVHRDGAEDAAETQIKRQRS